MPISPIKYHKPPVLATPGEEEGKKEPEVTPPQPPQIPDYFPGFGNQFRTAQQRFYETEQRMSLARQGAARLQTYWT